MKHQRSAEEIAILLGVPIEIILFIFEAQGWIKIESVNWNEEDLYLAPPVESSPAIHALLALKAFAGNEPGAMRRVRKASKLL